MLPSSDSELVIANFSIENQGYDAFDTDKTYFSAIVKGVDYKYDSDCYANNLLPDTEMMNGDKVKGNVPYTLPNLTMGTDITWQYTGPGEYDITWINLEPPPTKGTQTEFPET